MAVPSRRDHAVKQQMRLREKRLRDKQKIAAENDDSPPKEKNPEDIKAFIEMWKKLKKKDNNPQTR